MKIRSHQSRKWLLIDKERSNCIPDIPCILTLFSLYVPFSAVLALFVQPWCASLSTHIACSVSADGWVGMFTDASVVHEQKLFTLHDSVLHRYWRVVFVFPVRAARSEKLTASKIQWESNSTAAAVICRYGGFILSINKAFCVSKPDWNVHKWFVKLTTHMTRLIAR